MPYAPRPYTKNARHFSRRALCYRLRAGALRLYPPALARRLAGGRVTSLAGGRVTSRQATHRGSAGRLGVVGREDGKTSESERRGADGHVAP